MFSLRNVKKRFGDITAVAGIDLEVPRGRTLALIGASGCGKSTLLRLMLGLEQPDSGEVFFGDEQLSDANLLGIRQQVGYVIQDGGLFPHLDSAENIGVLARHMDWSSERRRERIAELCELTHFPESGLSRRPAQLSGGQRQRLTIARAIYRDAPILIFDEATSQIDSESELKIQGAIKTFATGRTTIIIAHCLSTIRFADRIAVMDQGAIIDSGTHAELFARCPLYRTLCQTQLGSEGAS